MSLRLTMIHELLLALSGHPSPLLSFPDGKTNDGDGSLQSSLSPAELALLRSLAEDLGIKHKNIRESAMKISSSHPSTVCRAVSTTVVYTHLADFQQKILEVEKDILEEDPAIVGAYSIVPLSAIVGAFDGWDRKLGWLWDLVQFIQPPRAHEATEGPGSGQGNTDQCTASKLIKRLRDSTHTGYPDIEQMSLGLVKVAETAWLMHISTWVLYGRYPTTRVQDFFIVRDGDGREGKPRDYRVEESLVPCFMTPVTANSILFIGRSLEHIRERQSKIVKGHIKTLTATELALLPNHRAHLSLLHSPISSSSFSTAIAAIRLSLSQNVLQKLLPNHRVLDILRLLKNFFLLERGEFAVALIAAADDRLKSRHQLVTGLDGTQNKNKYDLASMTIKEGEVTAVLARTWTALVSLQSVDDDDVDEELDQARELMRLHIKSLNSYAQGSKFTNARNGLSTDPFDDLLLPSSTNLSLRIPSPLDLFLTLSDVEMYSHMNAYLLAIRRGHLRLSKLFLLSVLRRDHPSPKASASLHQDERFSKLAYKRHRAAQRTRVMRPVWAAIGSATFFLAELGEYFHGEVIQSSWSTFYTWLVPTIEKDASSNETILMSSSFQSSLRLSDGQLSSRPASSRATDDTFSHGLHDPESLTQAHESYLASLEKSLLLDEPTFTSPLRRFMTAIDHISALVHRLSTVQHDLDADADFGSTEPSSNYAAEEQRLLVELKAARLRVASDVQGLIGALRIIDNAQLEGRVQHDDTNLLNHDGFVPWSGGGVDRLLLKFEYRSLQDMNFQQSGGG